MIPKEQFAKSKKSISNHVIQQQSLQAFALEIDCSPSKNFNSGNQNPIQFPTNANRCPQPTKKQSSVVAENSQFQNPQYIYARNAEQSTNQTTKKMLLVRLNNSIPSCFSNLITVCFHKTTISFLIKLFAVFIISPSELHSRTNE